MKASPPKKKKIVCFIWKPRLQLMKHGPCIRLCAKCSASRGCCNKLPQTEWLKAAGMILPFGGQRWEIGGSAGPRSFLEPLGEVLALSLAASGAVPLPEAAPLGPCFCLHMPPSSVCLSFPVLSLIKTLIFGFRTQQFNGR